MTTSSPKRSFGLKDLDEFRHRLAALRLELEPPTSLAEYVAHTDGACLGNPEGPGGWAARPARIRATRSRCPTVYWGRAPPQRVTTAPE